MHGPDASPLPVVLSPDPQPTVAGAGAGWPSWDEVLTIRRRCDPPALSPVPCPSWDELLGSR